MSIPFSHAILDDEGEVIRKYRWSNKEATWYKNTNPDAIVVPLPREKIQKVIFNTNDYEECLF